MRGTCACLRPLLPHWPVDATSRLPFLGPFVDEAHFLKHFAQVQQISSSTPRQFQLAASALTPVPPKAHRPRSIKARPCRARFWPFFFFFFILTFMRWPSSTSGFI